MSWRVRVEEDATGGARPSGVWFRSDLDETRYLPLADLYLPTRRELGELTERELRLMLSRAVEPGSESPGGDSA